MARGKGDSAEVNYYSEKLMRKLDRLLTSSAAIVEAPSGYGKTTAVRDLFKRSVSGKTPVYWFTAVDEPANISFRRFCYLINKIDESAATRLLKIGLPNSATIGEACDALRSIACHQETYLAVDNLQFIENALIPAFFHALVDHDVERLHVILITQILGLALQTAIAGCRYLHITAADLRLTGEDIRRFYSLAGVDISAEEAGRIEKYTEGWVIAVYLQLRAFLETGNFSESAIMPLMEHLVWNKMTEAQQVFLLRLSPFDAVTLQQASILTGYETLPSYALEALRSQFIRYDRGQQRYEVHLILQELLKQKCRERGSAFERECFLRAGDLYRDEGRTLEALGFLGWIKDYERLLTLDFSPHIFAEIAGTPFSEIAVDIARNCPCDIKKKYPLAMLRIAWALLAGDLCDDFEKLIADLQKIIESTEKEDTLLRGEWLLLSSFNSYPDLGKMVKTLNKAAPLFNGKCSQVILPDMPWCISPLQDFHLRPGEADREASLLDEYVTLLVRLTNGYGSGASALYSASLAYYRGNITEAETLAYKAAYLAGNKGQSIILMGAILILADVALYKADTESWQHAVISMEKAASAPYQNSFPVRSTIDLTHGMLFIELQQPDRLADWLKKGDFSEKRLLKNMKPIALCVHGLYLLNRGEGPQLIGALEANLEGDLMDRPFNHLFISLTLAAGYLNINNRDKAVELIRSAARRAMPDGLISLFAQYSWLLDGLTDKIIEKEYPEHYSSFQEIKNRFGHGWSRLYKDILPADLPSGLSKREREVALLAATGMRNSEIAQKLFISESTVRTHLRTVFKKLDIDRRVKLAAKLK